MGSISSLNLYPVNNDYYRSEWLLAELDRTFENGKMFFTFCEYEGQRYELTTAEPKVDLDITQWSESARNYICRLIEDEFQRGEFDDRLILSICPNGDERKYLRQYWVLRTAGSDGRIIFHFSAMRG